MNLLDGLENAGRYIGEQETDTATFVEAHFSGRDPTAEERLICRTLMSCAKSIDNALAKGREISRLVSSFNETLESLNEAAPIAGAIDDELADLLTRAK
ncbi:MAG: hypothetical protein LKJ44_06905 [Bifidobacteriaceae bacterium]|jgi:hypothetical protein|nr:hypothetical protein [Bifidobacteriaceae bacterium]MCI1979416.1 hypothetical protein [Bifidobacteriaceae bacterium]